MSSRFLKPIITKTIRAVVRAGMILKKPCKNNEYLVDLKIAGSDKILLVTRVGNMIENVLEAVVDHSSLFGI